MIIINQTLLCCVIRTFTNNFSVQFLVRVIGFDSKEKTNKQTKTNICIKKATLFKVIVISKLQNIYFVDIQTCYM